jgi:hypothetical protein
MNPRTLLAGLLLGLCVTHAAAQTTSVPLAGNNHTGYLALAGVKSFSTMPATSGTGNNVSLFPFYQEGTTWRTIVAEPLSAASVYPQESSFSVMNKSITDADFTSTNLGSFTHVSSLVTGIGTEVVPAAALSLTVNAADFSPFPTVANGGHNTGSGFGNFAWDYVITPSNLQGNGLTYENGVLISIDVTANIGVLPRFRNQEGTTILPFANDYDGTVTFSSNGFQFNLDVTQDVGSAFGTFEDTRMTFNRAGSINAVVPVPEPAWLLGGLVALMAVQLRKPRR